MFLRLKESKTLFFYKSPTSNLQISLYTVFDLKYPSLTLIVSRIDDGGMIVNLFLITVYFTLSLDPSIFTDSGFESALIINGLFCHLVIITYGLLPFFAKIIWVLFHVLLDYSHSTYQSI